MGSLAVILALALAGAAPPPARSCREGTTAADTVARRDVRLGPLTIMFARRTPREKRDAFDRHGWKLPVTLREGETATLSVPRRLRGRVGLVFTQRAQARVWRRGTRGADARVTFHACAADGAPTGWPGGIVVDRRRCATLRVRVAGTAEPIRRHVPLGRRCR